MENAIRREKQIKNWSRKALPPNSENLGARTRNFCHPTHHPRSATPYTEPPQGIPANPQWD
jgi:hypothetical protein